jgi:hypothetical protein
VITIESSPEPKLKRPKKPVRKVSVPLLAEINKIKRKSLRWYINHYNFGEVDADRAITLVENIKNLRPVNFYLKNDRLKEMTAKAVQLSKNAELAANEVSELEGIIQMAQFDERAAAKHLV